jgi:hypothetical protein
MQTKASSLNLGVGWVVSFGGFDCCFLFVIGGAENELESTLLTLILTPLKINTQFVCGFSCTLLNLTQILLNNSRSKWFSQDAQSNKQPPAEARCSLW